MATNTTFSYATQTSGYYDWTSTTNWAGGDPTSLPFPSYNVIINAGPAGAISLDDQTTSVVSLTVNAGAILDIAQGVTLTDGSNISGTGEINLLGSGSSLSIASAVPFANSLGFSFTGSNETLTLVAAQNATDTGTVTGFGPTDAIDFQSFASLTPSLTGNVLTVTSGGVFPTTFVFDNFATGAGFTGFTTVSDGSGGTLLEAVCFAVGTRLLTDLGERAVEELREGDRVVVLSGNARATVPIKWIGRLRANIARHPRPETIAPVRIRRGAFAENVPHRDLVLSPEHCVFVDGRLVPARCLVNDMTIVQEFDRPTIEYFHIETEPHAVVLAEGLTTETYLDTGNRAFFQNAGPAFVLHPEFHVNAGLRCWETDACAPLATAAEELEPIWQTLAGRAAALGYRRPAPAMTTDPALRLRVDGQEIAPIEHSAQRCLFVLPRGATAAIVVSRVALPSDRSPFLNDHRRLGVAIRRIMLRAGAEDRVIAADDPALTQGWHPVERNADEMWRWTDGAGIITLNGAVAPTILELHLGCSTAYRLEVEDISRRAA